MIFGMGLITSAVRGAVCCENTEESIIESTAGLYSGLLSKNGIPEDRIVSVVFTLTPDLNVCNPARALRLKGFCTKVPLFCCQEAFIEGMLPKVIRVLITWNADEDWLKKNTAVPLYMNGAEVLRPDLSGK